MVSSNAGQCATTTKKNISTSQATARKEWRELVHQLYSKWCVSMFLCAHCSETLWSTKNPLMHLLRERRDRLISNIYRAIEHLRKLLSAWWLHRFPSSPSWSFTKSANQKSTQQQCRFFIIILYYIFIKSLQGWNQNKREGEKRKDKKSSQLSDRNMGTEIKMTNRSLKKNITLMQVDYRDCSWAPSSQGFGKLSNEDLPQLNAGFRAHNFRTYAVSLSSRVIQSAQRMQPRPIPCYPLNSMTRKEKHFVQIVN